MRFTIPREILLKPLQSVANVVEKRNTIPVIGNVLVSATESELSLTATDLEIELVSRVPISFGKPGRTTLPAKKLLDICKTLPEKVDIDFILDKDRCILKAGKSRFVLATRSADEFPNIEKIHEGKSLTLSQGSFKRLFQKTHFSMSSSDIRYILMGALLDVSPGRVKVCTTDGHRLSVCETAVETQISTQVVVPRKGVSELMRLLQDSKNPLEVIVGRNHIQVILPEVTFTSKLIDGKFPEYQYIIPQQSSKVLLAQRDDLRRALQRVSILSNEKTRGVRFLLDKTSLRILSINPDKETAEEEIDAEYEGEPIDIGFNVGYLLDVLGVIDDDRVKIGMTAAENSVLLQNAGTTVCQYVVMPIRV